MSRAFREPIFQALFKQIQSNVQLNYSTISRNFISWSEIAQSQALMPAIYQVDGITYDISQLDGNGIFGATRYVLQARILAYASTDPSKDPGLAPSSLANSILDDIEQSLEPVVFGDLQTLGGLVVNAFFDGTGFVDPGINQSGLVAITMPVKIIVGYR